MYVLVVGDGPVADDFQSIVRSLGHECTISAPASAVASALDHRPDLVVPDLATVSASAIAWQIRCALREPVRMTALAHSATERAFGTNDRFLLPFDVNAIRAALAV
ncbi:MAG: hypothetical protein QM831_11490 [Kofleriaceae bacterium]